MNISLISNIFEPHVRGGYELGCQAIASRLKALGHQVTVLTSQSPGVLDKTVVTNGIAVRRIFEPVFEYEEPLARLFGRSPLWQRRVDNAFGGVLPANVLALDQYFAAHAPEVIWLFNPLGLGPVGIAEAITGQRAKCLFHLMDHIDDMLAAHQRFHHYLGRWRRTKQRLTAISCSAKTQESNEKLGPYRRHHVIYNGFSQTELPAAAPRSAPSGPFRFVYFGQLSREKGLPQVIRAFAALVGQLPQAECTLDILGKGAPEFEAELRKQIADAGLAGRVGWLGFTPKDQLLARLAQYDAAVMLLNPAEPFGYAPLEAACAGLAVVTTTGTGIAETFPRGYPLLVADREDTEAVQKKLAWCVSHRAELPPLARQLWQHVAGQCDFDRVTLPAYLRVIEETPVNDGHFDVRSLLAANTTVEFYSQFN